MTTIARFPVEWRRWPSWVGYVAAAWCLGYGLLALYWAAGGAGFPFGEGDSEEMGSLLVAARPAPTGTVIGLSCLLGAFVCGAMTKGWGRRAPRALLLLGYGWTMAVLLVLFVPDVRILRNIAYTLGFQFGAFDWPGVNMLICMAGGALIGLTTLAYQRRLTGRCPHCGRQTGQHPCEPARIGRGLSVFRARDPILVERARWNSPAGAARWGRWATYAAVVLPLPYAAVRLAWALGIPLGVDELNGVTSSGALIMISTLVLPSLIGDVLTTGLVKRWGEVFPRWLPLVGGRDVPVSLAVVPAAFAATVILVGGQFFYRLALTEALGWSEPIKAGEGVSGWGVALPGYLFLPWGLALAAATYAYYLRRRGACRMCMPQGGPAST